VFVGIRKGFRYIFDTVKNAEWWMPLLLLLVTPLLPIFLLFILFDKKNEPWKSKVNVEQQKQKEREMQQRKKEYAQSVACLDKQIISDCVAVGYQIVDSVHKKQYDNLFDSLNEISLPDGFSLKVILCKVPQGNEYYIGDSSSLYIATKDGNKEKDIFKYINVTDSYQGAWQVYLLHTLWHLLPVFWHGAYDSRTMIFDAQDLQERIDLVNKNPHFYHVTLDASKFQLLPEISKNGDKYFVSCCYWSDWKGLVREVVVITIKDNKAQNVQTICEQIEYQYDCGMRM
jgi:hypothetical protein